MLSAPSFAVAVRFGVVALACVTAFVYFTWRVGVVNPAVPVFSWLVLGAELVGFLRMLAFLVSTAGTEDREPPPAPPELAVDVFVTTYDEPIDVVRRTVMAALAIRYPHETWLLDDGNRGPMRQIADELGCRYLARTDNADAKAGNLNAALTVARGAFVAVFDADHVADPRFLDRTLGYFRDDAVGFVQTPHAFFNHDSFEHLSPKRREADGQSFFHQTVQRSREAAGATLFTGSSAVFRRTALDDVGGFGTGTVTEDVQTSLRLHAAGWQSVLHAEVLSAGMAPVDAAGFSVQRLRWAQGAVEILFRENLLRASRLTPRQRRWYLMHVANNVEGVRHLFIYALPIFMLFTGMVPLTAHAPAFSSRFVPYALGSMLACWTVSRGHMRIFEAWVYNLARCPTSVIAIFLACRKRRYRVTPKARGERARPLEAAFPAALIAGTLGAATYATWGVLAHRSPLDPDALAVLCAWGAVHVTTSTRLLLLIRRCANDRRTATRFPCVAPARLTGIAGAGAAYAVEVTAASADGFTFRVPAGAPLPPAGAYAGLVELGTDRAPFACAVRPDRGGRLFGGAVTWPDGAVRARFDLALHYKAIERLRSANRPPLALPPIRIAERLFVSISNSTKRKSSERAITFPLDGEDERTARA